MTNTNFLEETPQGTEPVLSTVGDVEEKLLTISIDRKAKKYAIFDGFTCVGGFIAYTDENQALEDCKAKVAAQTSVPPEIVYPVVKVMRYSRSSK